MKKTLIVLTVLTLVGAGAALAASFADSGAARDPSRPDCPGLIECPLTGEPICADKCPLRTGETEKPVPPCCRGK